MTTLVSGLVALVIAASLWTYLRFKARDLQLGAELLGQFGALAREIAEREMPERKLQNLVSLSHYAGTGHIARRIFHELANGNLASPPSRETVAARRKEWEAYNSATRILFVRAYFSALLADSYFSGPIQGRLFRRVFFYVTSDPAEIAKSVDAFETRVLLLGAERAVARKVEQEVKPQDCDDLVTA